MHNDRVADPAIKITGIWIRIRTPYYPDPEHLENSRSESISDGDRDPAKYHRSGSGRLKLPDPEGEMIRLYLAGRHSGRQQRILDPVQVGQPLLHSYQTSVIVFVWSFTCKFD